MKLVKMMKNGTQKIKNRKLSKERKIMIAIIAIPIIIGVVATKAIISKWESEQYHQRTMARLERIKEEEYLDENPKISSYSKMPWCLDYGAYTRCTLVEEGSMEEHGTKYALYRYKGRNSEKYYYTTGLGSYISRLKEDGWRCEVNYDERKRSTEYALYKNFGKKVNAIMVTESGSKELRNLNVELVAIENLK